MRTLKLDEARRIAVRAQLLDAERPTDLLAVVERLTFLQLDPTAAVAPSADLIAWSRIGNAYQPHLQQALETDRSLFEYLSRDSAVEPGLAMVRRMSDRGLYRLDVAEWSARRPDAARWLDANDGFRRRLLDVLSASGPLASHDIPDSADVPWQSTGWTNDRNVTQMLEFLLARGEVAVAARKGRQRVWDLAERVYPPDTLVLPEDEVRRLRDERRLRALGVARPQRVGDAGTPVEIEGTAGEWRVDPKASADGFAGRTALLSPFDRLIHDRVRSVDLFDFEYILEMYKPKDKRRWGYFALPVLHHDRLVGKVDATVDKKASVLHVHAVHPDVRFTKVISTGIHREIDTLADWLGLETVRRA